MNKYALWNLLLCELHLYFTDWNSLTRTINFVTNSLITVYSNSLQLSSSNAQHVYSPCTYRDALKSIRVEEWTANEQWKDGFYVVPSPLSWGICPSSQTISINADVLGTRPVKYPQVQGLTNNIQNESFQPIYWHWKLLINRDV